MRDRKSLKGIATKYYVATTKFVATIDRGFMGREATGGASDEPERCELGAAARRANGRARSPSAPNAGTPKQNVSEKLGQPGRSDPTRQGAIGRARSPSAPDAETQERDASNKPGWPGRSDPSALES